MRKFKITDLLIWIVGAELYGAVSAIVGGNFNGFYDICVVGRICIYSF